MMILACIPLGILSLTLALLCLRSGRRRHAIACAVIGFFFLGAAMLMSYGTRVLLQEIARTT